MIYGVMPTRGRECLAACLDALLPQLDHMFLVWTGEAGQCPVHSSMVSVIDASRQPVNISAWWNLGLRAADEAARLFGDASWDVLVVNDDVIVPDRLVTSLHEGLRDTWDTAPALAYPDQDGNGWHLAVRPDDPARMTGYCFLLRGELGIRADESLVWWYGDNLIDMDARARGGSLRVFGCPVQHLHPSGYTVASAELSAQAHRDAVTFGEIMRSRT